MFSSYLPKPEAVDSGRIGTRRKSIPRQAAESTRGAGLWFEAQGSELLACGAAARSRASSIEAMSSSSTHSLEVPSPLPKKAKSGFRRQGFQDWSLVSRALPLFEIPPERVRLHVQAESGNLFNIPHFSFKTRRFLPGLFHSFEMYTIRNFIPAGVPKDSAVHLCSIYRFLCFSADVWLRLFV
ncbi:hypothetical protein C6I21_02935 [Alkalicoccus urumqiensis]|uniref:Uncharacterized protein n=1 Tax=Alkalicoccus urumqiensis TaxID=1548213 RepID=A0A2P6MKT3_ALKUR|nr:hypothetical protein C6I21_02935 [Alkalicoccus urumqiensis]